MVAKVDEIGYLNGDVSLLSMENFTELFLVSLAKKDGVYDLDNENTTVFLPGEFIEKIDDYLHGEYDDIEVFKKIRNVIDLDFYFKNEDVWYDELLKLLNKTVDGNDSLNKMYDFNNEGIRVTFPTIAIQNAFSKFDSDLFDAVGGLTDYILEDVKLNKDSDNKEYINAELLVTCLAKNKGIYDLDDESVKVELPLNLKEIVDDFMYSYDENDFFLLNDSVDVTSYFFDQEKWYDNFTKALNNLAIYDKEIKQDYDFYEDKVTYEIPTERILKNINKYSSRSLDGMNRLADYINNYDHRFDLDMDNPSFVRTLNK